MITNALVMALKNTECLIGFHPGGAVDQLSSAGCG